MANSAPRWVWIFTPLVALTFVGFLAYLTTVPANDDIDTITRSLSDKALQAKNKAKEAINAGIQTAIKAELPKTFNDSTDKAVDNYEFFEILENKSVDVEEVAEYKSTPKGTDKDGNKIQYRLKAASFKTLERADQLKAQLLLNGFNTQTEAAIINGKTWYRVFTGPFNNRSKMNKAQDQLAAMGMQAVEIKKIIK